MSSHWARPPRTDHLCAEAPAEPGKIAPWACYQNFDKRAPVLPYGQRIEGAGFRCASQPGGITCALNSGHGAGKGFRISGSEAVEVSPS